MMKRSAVLAVVSVLIFSAPSAFAKAQDIVKMNTDIEIERGQTCGEVVAIGGDVTVSGKVENNVVVIGGSAIFKPGSQVGGQVVVVGGDIVKDPTASIGERITQIYMPHFIPSLTTMIKGGWIALWATISVLVLLGFIGLAVLLAALIPEHMGSAIRAMERSFVGMFLWGILWSILIVPIAVMLAISIIGIALIPLEILLVVLALIIGYITSATFIGKNVTARMGKRSHPFVDAILGLLVLFFVGFVPILGTPIKVIFLMAGFGAVLTTRFGTIK
ncbi:MAG: hypothetical protein WC515_06060 [Candidatus Omnitrophota bacterium]